MQLELQRPVVMPTRAVELESWWWFLLILLLLDVPLFLQDGGGVVVYSHP